MKVPSNKQICVSLVSLLVASSFLCRLRFLSADDNENFVTFQIEEIRNFGECSNQIFQIVARKMGIKIDDRIPKPIIFTDKQMTLKKYNRYLGWDAEVVCPYYFHKKNTIVIPMDCKLDSLAHELVHYFQVMYRNEDLDFACGPHIESLEMEAVAIQRWFKAKYLEPQNANTGFMHNFSYQIITAR